MRKEMSGGVCLERVGFLDLTTAAGHMHLGLADFDLGKFRSRRFKNGIVNLTGLAGGKAVRDDCTGAVGEFLVVGVADVENGAHTEVLSPELSAEYQDSASALNAQH